jgi:hypothetical protein
MLSSIVIVHGLGGHPFMTFAAKSWQTERVISAKSPECLPSPKSPRRFWARLSCSHISDDEEDICAIIPEQHTGRELHWPRDLLPRDCSDARILVWGYDSHISKGYAGSNKSNIFAHAKDLLYSLQREKPPRRPIIFVAHSLGGLIVKEVA